MDRLLGPPIGLLGEGCCMVGLWVESRLREGHAYRADRAAVMGRGVVDLGPFQHVQPFVAPWYTRMRL